MARLPDVDSFGARPVPQSRERFVPAARPGIDIGGALVQIGEQIQVQADRAAFSEKDTQITSEVNALLLDPEKGALNRRGKDAIGLSKKTLEDFDKKAAELSNGLTTRAQKDAYQERIRGLRSNIESDLLRHESREQENYFDDTDQSRIATSVEAAAVTPDDPARIEGELTLQRSILSGIAKRKGWDSVTTERARVEAETKTHESVIGRLLLENRYDDAGRYLSANMMRMNDAAVESMQRRILADEEMAIRTLDLQRRVVNDEVVKNGDKLLAEGRLSSGWIEQNRNALSKEDYRYFYNKLKGDDEDGPRDSMLYADLRERAGLGQDVRAEAREALRRKQIGSSDYDRIVGEVESERPGWYKRGSQFISTSAAVSDLNPDPAAAQRKAEMLDDWNLWSIENPKATDTEAQTAYKRIVDEYAIINLDQFTLTKRMPKYLVGGRAAPDIDASEDATVRAYESGEIDRNEFERQSALLSEWRQALKSQPKPKASK